MSSGSHGQRNLPIRGARQPYRGNEGDEPGSRVGRAHAMIIDDEEGEEGEDQVLDVENELERRKYEVSDFVSSFEDSILPWEWAQREGINARITMIEATLDPSNWTDNKHLEHSLVKQACYNQDGLARQLFRNIKGPRELATVFQQKLSNRIRLHFSRYDAGQVDAEDTAELLRELAEKAEDDRIWRGDEDHDKALWKMFLGVLERASEAVSAPPEVSPVPPRARGIAWEETLFYELFQRGQDANLMLATFEGIKVSSLDAATRAESRQRVEEVLQQLVLYRARPAYRARLEQILLRFSTP